MGIPGSANLLLAGGGAQAYEIEQSLRFDGGRPSRLTYDNSSGTNNSSSAWTLSFWMKRGSDVVTSQYGNDLHLMMWTPSGSCANTEYFLIADPQHGTTSIQNCMSFRGGGYSGNAANKLRDCSAWYHFVWRGNTGSSSNIIYINGEPVTAYNQGPSSMTSQYVNGQSRWSIGNSYTGCSSNPWDGYLAEVIFVDGQTLDHEDFGEFDDNGVWRPIQYTGTFGTNGYYLKFDPSATNGVGHDHSGNGHHWTASNINTSGSNTDVFSDTPTNNFMVWNRNNKYHSDQHETQEANLRFETVSSGDSSEIRGTFATNTGKWYCEFTLNSANGTSVGLVQSRYQNYSSWIGNGVDPTKDAYSWAYRTDNGSTFHDQVTTSSYGSSLGNGDILMMAWDVDAGKIWWGKNGTWFSSGNPASGTNPAYTDSDISSGEFLDVACGHPGTNASITMNAGQRAFGYTPPSGFKTLCTANLPAPDIADGSDYFNTSLWTGTGSPVGITGVGFQPDLVWVKARSRTADHKLQDSVRGSYRYLQSNLQNGENTNSANDWFRSFDSDGFTVAQYTTGGTSTSEWAGNGDTYVGWSWLAANGTSSNTAGGITSTVSVNASAGFSIVTYSGSAQNDTVGHGLGVAPSLIIFKRLNNTTSWPVYHSAIGPSNLVQLNEYAAQSSSGNSFGSTPTAPTSTVFSVGDNGGTNYGDMVAYCFAEVEGYSKVGTYEGNGSSDGPFIYCGFKPAWIMFKHYSGSIAYQENAIWAIYDAKRDTYNVADAKLQAHVTSPESTSAAIDILSNGFKLRGVGDERNKGSGSYYLYVAFAQHPFGGDGVSPATAR